MRCLNEPKLEQDEGHQQDGDTGDIAPAPYWQFGRRGLTRRESCRHLRRIPREVVPALGTPINLPINVNILWLFRGCTRIFAWTCLSGVSLRLAEHAECGEYVPFNKDEGGGAYAGYIREV